MMYRIFTLCCVVVLAGFPTHASADKDASVAVYKKGKKKYNLGEFEAAIELFKDAYDEYAAPAYLYNIAQSYRQLDNCPRARFFYQRFLSEKPGSRQEEKIKGYVAKLEQECGEGEQHPIDEIDDPVVAVPTPTEPVKKEAAPAEVSKPVREPAQIETEDSSPFLVVRAAAGPASFQLGDVVVPLAATVRVSAAYPMSFGGFEVEGGVSLLLSSMPYQAQQTDERLLFTTVLANFAAYHRVADGRLGGELGLGLLQVGGVKAGNPFTMAGAERNDSANSLAVRLGVGGDYPLSDALAAEAAVGMTYGSPSDDLADDIESIINLQVLGGLRYRF